MAPLGRMIRAFNSGSGSPERTTASRTRVSRGDREQARTSAIAARMRRAPRTWVRVRARATSSSSSTSGSGSPTKKSPATMRSSRLRICPRDNHVSIGDVTRSPSTSIISGRVFVLWPTTFLPRGARSERKASTWTRQSVSSSRGSGMFRSRAAEHVAKTTSSEHTVA